MTSVLFTLGRYISDHVPAPSLVQAYGSTLTLTLTPTLTLTLTPTLTLTLSQP